MSSSNYGIRTFYTLIILIFLWAVSGCTAKKSQNRGKPGIILIMIDNVGYAEFGINGNGVVHTPRLDDFARKGVQFSRFYSNPMCAPTRASLMTGRYFYRTGIIHTSRGGAKMWGDETTIGELLKKEGYATGVFGKWHLGDNYPMRPQDQGFDETLIHRSGRLGQVPDWPNTYIDPKLWENGTYVQKEGYCTDIFFNAAIHFIEKHRGDPFFIYLPTNIGHTSRGVGPNVPERYRKPYLNLGLDDEAVTVCGMLDNFDENFGRLIKTLDLLNLRGNTVVIFLSDDGRVRVNKTGYHGEGKYSSTWEGSTKVPCFIQWPGHFPGGRVIDKIASHIDILPTIVDILGNEIQPDSTPDGFSLLPLLKGDTLKWPERMIFLQCHRGMFPQRYQNAAVLTDRFKLNLYPDTFNDRNLVTSRDHPVMELYDIPADPRERNNLAGQYPGIADSLRKAYDRWFDDVKQSRNFAPGRIHIGSMEENPVYLSRYQDASYIHRKPAGWPVVTEQAGKYEISINRGTGTAAGTLLVKYDSMIIRQPLFEGKDRAIFELPRGAYQLHIWFQEQGKTYIPRPDEDLIGDVLIKYTGKP